MFIEKLTVSGFRNLKPAQISFDRSLVFIVGPNGQGKTNLLEAIYLLAHAKSFRAGSLDDLVNWEQQREGETACALSASVTAAEGRRSVEYKITDGRRRVFVNGNKVTAPSQFYGQLNVIEFTPDDVQLIKGAPSGRRRFLDRILAMVDRNFVESAVAYQRSLKSRNALLKSLKAAGGGELEQLATWEQMLVDHGCIVSAKRNELITELRERFLEHYQRLVGEYSGELRDALERPTLSFNSHFVDDGELRSREALLEMYRETRERDVQRKASGRGSHRDDLDIDLERYGETRAARTSASQGQARSLALALKLAAVDYLYQRCGEAPVVLLDDIESELDTWRKSALFQSILQLESHVFVTTTELSELAEQERERSQVLHMRAGSTAVEKTP